MVTTKKTVKKVKTPLTDEDKILGKTSEVKTVLDVEYDNPNKKYKIYNLELNNNPVVVTGKEVGFFLGTKNRLQRDELKQGAKMVIAKDANGKDLYKIELLEG